MNATVHDLAQALAARIRSEQARRSGVVHLCGICHKCSADEVVDGQHVCSRCVPQARAHRRVR